MAKSTVVPAWQRALIVLTGTVLFVVVVNCLYWAQTVFIPVALAIFLTFLLAPLVTALQRRGLGRMPAVVLVALAAALVLGGVVWLVAVEVTGLAGELPTYTKNINAKVRSLREMNQGSALGHLDKMIQDVSGAWRSPLAIPDVVGQPAAPAVAVPEKPSAVVVQPESPAWLSALPTVLSHVAESLGGLAMALVLVVFMLLKREELRNRLIRLVGHGRMTVMTKAVDDAGQRISRYLVVQLIINASFGFVLAVGLLLLQVPHALLWGFLGAVLRYVPYLGTWITAAALMTLTLAASSGWVQPILVLGFFVALELVAANVLEPRLFGRSIGVSEVALLVAAAFWAFLWGPVGLILSSPLTVCLVVLGKYVPQLEFLDVLLGDELALDAEVTYYQRLLARDQDEASQLVLAHAKTAPLEDVYDRLLVPALTFARQDRERGDLTDADEQFVVQATREVLEDLSERRLAAGPAESTATEPTAAKVHILAYPARDKSDHLALEMLQSLLDPARWTVEVGAVETLTAELVAQVADQRPALICIGALPPGGLAHTRYSCKRLRARFPGVKIVVGRWGLKEHVAENREQLEEAGADLMATTLLETRNQLNDWLPVLAQNVARSAAG